jgi:prevent-host-death family protein
MTHTVKDAKNNLSNLIRLAEKGEPQIIRRNDTEVAVVISIDEWRKINGKKQSLFELLRSCPAGFDELDLTRQEDYPREFSFGD